MERLRELARKLGNPGEAKLYTAARKRGIPVTRSQIKQYLAQRPERQIFRPLRRSSGATGSEGLDVQFQMDLIEFRTNPSKGFKYILVLIKVFSRQVWCEPVKDKTPPTRSSPYCAACSRHFPKSPQ